MKFVPNEELEYYDNEVLKLDELDKDNTFVGYISSGIIPNEFQNDWKEFILFFI